MEVCHRAVFRRSVDFTLMHAFATGIWKSAGSKLMTTVAWSIHPNATYKHISIMILKTKLNGYDPVKQALDEHSRHANIKFNQQMQKYFNTIGRWSHEWPIRNAIGSVLLCTFATHSSNFVTSDVSSCMAEALGTPATTCILKEVVRTKLGDTRIWFSVGLKSVCYAN